MLKENEQIYTCIKQSFVNFHFTHYNILLPSNNRNMKYYCWFLLCISVTLYWHHCYRMDKFSISILSLICFTWIELLITISQSRGTIGLHSFCLSDFMIPPIQRFFFFKSQDGQRAIILRTFYWYFCMLSPVTGSWFEIMSLYFGMKCCIYNEGLIHTKYINKKKERWLNGGHFEDILLTFL
jgi:hypothetical protein